MRHLKLCANMKVPTTDIEANFGILWPEVKFLRGLPNICLLGY